MYGTLLVIVGMWGTWGVVNPGDFVRPPERFQSIRLFESRCVRCHVEPALSRYSDLDWRHLFDIMAARAGLSVSERQKVRAYLKLMN